LKYYPLQSHFDPSRIFLFKKTMTRITPHLRGQTRDMLKTLIESLKNGRLKKRKKNPTIEKELKKRTI